MEEIRIKETSWSLKSLCIPRNLWEILMEIMSSSMFCKLKTLTSTLKLASNCSDPCSNLADKSILQMWLRNVWSSIQKMWLISWYKKCCKQNPILISSKTSTATTWFKRPYKSPKNLPRARCLPKSNSTCTSSRTAIPSLSRSTVNSSKRIQSWPSTDLQQLKNL